MDIDRYEILRSFKKNCQTTASKVMMLQFKWSKLKWQNVIQFEMAISKLRKRKSQSPDRLISELYRHFEFSFPNLLLPLFQSAFSSVKILGNPDLSRRIKKEEFLKSLKNSKIRLNRFMSYRAKFIAVSFFVIPQITHNERNNFCT